MSDTRTVNAIHGAIAIRAAEIANAHQDKHEAFFFHPAAVASEKTAKGIDGYCLEWDPAGDIGRYDAETREWIIYHMESIGREAIKQSIIENGSSFVALILGEARERRNYFDHFNNNTTLDTLS